MIRWPAAIGDVYRIKAVEYIGLSLSKIHSIKIYWQKLFPHGTVDVYRAGNCKLAKTLKLKGSARDLKCTQYVNFKKQEL